MGVLRAGAGGAGGVGAAAAGTVTKGITPAGGAIAGSSGGAGKSGIAIGKSGRSGNPAAVVTSVVEIFGAPAGSLASIAAGSLVASAKNSFGFLYGIISLLSCSSFYL